MAEHGKRIVNAALASILRQGAYHILRDSDRQTRITELTHKLVLDAVANIVGFEAHRALAQTGLERLHEHLPAEQIGALRDQVMPQLRAELFRFAVDVGSEFLGLQNEFFIDDYTILRINFPFETAIAARGPTENPGIGRTAPQVRSMASSTQKRDPVYDPKAYHQGTPPVSWAHGAHKDTWTGHSRDGINLWLAISQVTQENAMILYPGTLGKAYRADPRSLYLAAGYALPEPHKMALNAGELLVFNPELLHATHLNVSGQTRVALSVRINPLRPRFSDRCFYAREFWHSSSDIAAGHCDRVQRFAREMHMERAVDLPEEAPVERVISDPIRTRPAGNSAEEIRCAEIPAEARRIPVELLDGERIILLREASGWRGVQERCPHLDISLMDGHHCDGQIFCPAHGVAFDTDNGCSSSALLRLRTYRVTAHDNALVIHR